MRPAAALPRRRWRVVATAGLLASAGLTAACGSPPTDREPGPRTLEGRAPAVVEEVAVRPSGFSVEEVALTGGEALELANAGGEPVRVVGHLGDARRYDTGDLAPGEATVVAFTEPGRYRFTLAGEDGPALVVTVSY